MLEADETEPQAGKGRGDAFEVEVMLLDVEKEIPQTAEGMEVGAAGEIREFRAELAPQQGGTEGTRIPSGVGGPLGAG